MEFKKLEIILGQDEFVHISANVSSLCVGNPPDFG